MAVKDFISTMKMLATPSELPKKLEDYKNEIIKHGATEEDIRVVNHELTMARLNALR